MMNRKRQFYLTTYGASLVEYAKSINRQIKVQKTTGEILSIAKDIYICPLCLQNFYYLINDEYFETTTFSDDHYPPNSVGGEQTILVCKPCNDTYGRKMDFTLKKYLESQAFLNKKTNAFYPLKFSYKGIPGNYNIETKWDKGKMVQNVNFKKYPYIKDWLMDLKKEEWAFKLKISTPSEDIIAKALLRAAYLYCFSNWGYDFVYSFTADRIRNVLQGNAQHPLSNYGVFGDVSSKSLQNGFYFISAPKKYQAFQVLFNIRLTDPEISQKVFVIIPANSENAWSDLENFKPWLEKKSANAKVIKLYNDCVIKGFYGHYSFTGNELNELKDR